MSVRVVKPPKAFVTPDDIPGDHDADDDAFLTLLIEGVQSEIDGGAGWLGRSLGEQTLELTGWICGRRYRLPFPPIIDVESVSFRTEHGDWELADPSSWKLDGDELVLANGAGWVRHPHHRIVFRAGYDGEKTGSVPPNAKAAIILGVNLLRSMGADDIFLQQETVTGAHSMTRNVTPYVAETIQKAVTNLLAPLRVYL